MSSGFKNMSYEILEEVFIKPAFPDHVFKLKKYLYGMKQSLRALYDHLSKFLLGKNIQRGQVAKNIFIKKSKHNILLFQIYLNIIIFGATNESS